MHTLPRTQSSLYFGSLCGLSLSLSLSLSPSANCVSGQYPVVSHRLAAIVLADPSAQMRLQTGRCMRQNGQKRKKQPFNSSQFSPCIFLRLTTFSIFTSVSVSPPSLILISPLFQTTRTRSSDAHLFCAGHIMKMEGTLKQVIYDARDTAKCAFEPLKEGLLSGLTALLGCNLIILSWI